VAHDRRYVLAGLTLLVALVSAYFLRRILPTVFFAVTVAYLLAPVESFYERRGLSTWWASTATTATGVVALLALVSPIAALLYLRSEDLIEFLRAIPTEVDLELFGFAVTVTVEQVQTVLLDVGESVATSAATAAPVLTIKATVFAIVVFALLAGRRRVHDAVRAVVPVGYRGVLASLTDRARDTLYAIYVLQAATAAVTFVIALPVFFGLGYDFWFSFSVIAGMLQFIPIVGPSVLVLAMAAGDLIVENPTRAATVTVLGLVFIAYLPDPMVRPRLARRTADLPGSLYFIGFTGGLFTIGVVGVIAGPLLVALLAECVELLGEEMDGRRGDDPDAGVETRTGEPEPEGPPAGDPSSDDSPSADPAPDDGEAGTPAPGDEPGDEDDDGPAPV
jgi:predicted PurR-regulated permease PerM